MCRGIRARLLSYSAQNRQKELCCQGWLHEECHVEPKHKHLIIVRKRLEHTSKIWRQNDNLLSSHVHFFWYENNFSGMKIMKIRTQILYKSKKAKGCTNMTDKPEHS